MNDSFNKDAKKRMAAQEADQSSWRSKPSPKEPEESNKRAARKSPTSPVKKKKYFVSEKHPYDEVVKGKRVAIPTFYNSTYERMV